MTCADATGQNHLQKDPESGTVRAVRVGVQGSGSRAHEQLKP